MQPTNPNAHTYVNGTDVDTDGLSNHAEHFSETVDLNSLVHLECKVSSVACRA